MSDEEVLVSVEDGVASVTLNRPHRKNAITGPLADGLADAFRAVSARDDVNVVLLSGAGGGFCSGLDLVEYNADPPPPWMSTATESLVAAHLAIFDCPVPVVGALERFAVNGGAAFALACDLLVAGETSFIQIGEIRQGMAAPMNLAWLLARYPVSVASQLVLTGRRFNGPDLHRLGVALDVVADTEVKESARALAVDIAEWSSANVRNLKGAIRDLGAVGGPVSDQVGGRAWFDRVRASMPLPTGGGMRPIHVDGERIDR